MIENEHQVYVYHGMLVVPVLGAGTGLGLEGKMCTNKAGTPAIFKSGKQCLYVTVVTTGGYRVKQIKSMSIQRL